MKRVTLKNKHGDTVEAFTEDYVIYVVDDRELSEKVLTLLGFEEVVPTKPERREFYIKPDGTRWDVWDDVKDRIILKEIRPGERVLSREDVERAWDHMDNAPSRSHQAIAFKKFIKALGFEEETKDD